MSAFRSTGLAVSQLDGYWRMNSRAFSTRVEPGVVGAFVENRRHALFRAGLLVAVQQRMAVGVDREQGVAQQHLAIRAVHCAHTPATPMGLPSMREMRVGRALPLR